MLSRAALVLLVAASTTAAADSKHHKKDDAAQPAPKPKVPRAPGPEDAKAKELLERIVAGPDAAARQAAMTELTTIAPQAVDEIGEWLVRPHATDIGDRRAVLKEIKASVPDKSGRFSQPERQTGKERIADDDIDWMKGLLAVDPAQPGLGEVIGDDAAIRALAGTKDLRAAQLIFDAAFVDDTMIFRDECGRYLRKLEPASLPALTKESQGRDDRKRYATWQLEHLDRQEPYKALSATTGDEAVTVALLGVFRQTHHREAVHAVWTYTNADSPRVRAAARAAWMDYITGPPPPPAPKAKLKLPGGKETKKPKPLWLTYRELADNELRKAANELLKEDYPLADPSIGDDDTEAKSVKVDLEDLTKRLFAYFDGERAKAEGAEWAATQKLAERGDLPGAIASMDRMLARNPQRGDDAQRAAMAKLYAQWGKQLEGKQQWELAAGAYSKATLLDPKGPGANDTLAAQHYTLGKALEAQGKDGGPDFRAAVVLKPDYQPAKASAARVAERTKPSWMLLAAAGAGATAILLFAIAMMRRRA